MNAAPTLPEAVKRALQRAGAFVEVYGTALARARFLALQDASARESVVELLVPWRGSDGGFAPLHGTSPAAGEASTVVGMLAALEVLDAIGVRRGALLEGAVAWLARTQSVDGAWYDGAERPGDAKQENALRSERRAVFLTGMIAGHLAKLPYGSPAMLARAEAFLDVRFSPERVEDAQGLGLLAYAHVCTNGSFERADEALQWCGRALEKGFRGGWLGPVAVARTLLLSDTPALPGGRVSASEVVLALLAAQQPDGSFDDGRLEVPLRIEATLTGARALVRFGTAR